MNRLRLILDFAREAFRAEFMTPAGVINVILVFLCFVLVSAMGLGDAWQILVRTVKADYESGMPAFAWLLLEFALIGLACVLIVGLLTRPPRS
jgi:flagellar biosynthesis protein FlhB